MCDTDRNICYNPYLPLWETVADGEPHAFGGRIYIYGSHDLIGGDTFCPQDYVCYSAPVDNLKNWRYEGVIYKKSQDPLNGAENYVKNLPSEGVPRREGEMHAMFAPDVCQGPDGRYYLYYGLSGVNCISVAVCDTPAGKYEFLDYVRYADDRLLEGEQYFDPAVISEANGNYLYYGFCPTFSIPGVSDDPTEGGRVVQLADDMHTMISPPRTVAFGPDFAKGTSYEEHPFFEASSIRHFGEWYYFIYSSVKMHELCYGMAKSPEGPFEYRGIVISNANIGYHGNSVPKNYMANNHGSIEKAGDKYWVFWHRHTMATQFSRQSCADRILMRQDGSFEQAEITSCGLNEEPLPTGETYSASIACCITGPDMERTNTIPNHGSGVIVPPEPDVPFVNIEKDSGYEKGIHSYLFNIRKNACAEYRYFAFSGDENKVDVWLRGDGSIALYLDEIKIGEMNSKDKGWEKHTLEYKAGSGKKVFRIHGVTGRVDISEFKFYKSEVANRD